MADGQLEALRARIRAVVANTVAGGTLDYGVARGERELLARAIVTLGYRSRPRRPVALNALIRLPVTLHGREIDVLHLGLALVRPEVRSLGLCHRLYFLPLILGLLRNRWRPFWVSNVSQVPSAIGQMSEHFDSVYPGPDPDGSPSPHHRAVAGQVFARHRSAFGVGEDASFDPDRHVIRNAYTGGSDNLKKAFDETTKHRLAKYNELCAATLDYGRGDDFLQVGRYTVAALRRSIRQARVRPVRVGAPDLSHPAWSWFLANLRAEPTEM